MMICTECMKIYQARKVYKEDVDAVDDVLREYLSSL